MGGIPFKKYVCEGVFGSIEHISIYIYIVWSSRLYRDGFLDTEEKLLWMEYAVIKKYMKKYKEYQNDGT